MKALSPGTFALFRIGFGLWLAAQFVALLPGASGFWLATCMLGTVGALLLMAGWRRGRVALALGLLWTGLSLQKDASFALVNIDTGLLLILLALVPEGEPWRWRGRSVPPRDWAMPRAVFVGAWSMLAIFHLCGGLAKLLDPSWTEGTALPLLFDGSQAHLELGRDLVLSLPAWAHTGVAWTVAAAQVAFLPLCLTRRGRLAGWLALGVLQVGLLALAGFTAAGVGLLWIHVFAFDAGWLPPRERAGRGALLLYDGECGLCNAVVRWLLREDSTGVLRFAALQGPSGQATLGRLGLPTEDFDSLVFLPDADGPEHRVRTAGVLAVLDAIGGVWRVAALVGGIIPGPLRDAAYRAVARLRYRLFGEYRPTPLPDPAWAARFLE